MTALTLNTKNLDVTKAILDNRCCLFLFSKEKTKRKEKKKGYLFLVAMKVSRLIAIHKCQVD